MKKRNSLHNCAGYLSKQDGMQRFYKQIIEKGSIKQLREMTYKDFHKINHFDSFQIIINRLEKVESEKLKLKGEIQSFIYNLNFNLNEYNIESVSAFSVIRKLKEIYQ